MKIGVQGQCGKCATFKKKLPCTQQSDKSLPPLNWHQRASKMYHETGKPHLSFQGLPQMTRQSVARRNARHNSDMQHILGPLNTAGEKKKAMLGTSSQTRLRTIHQLVLLRKQNIPTLHFTNAMHPGLYHCGGQYCQGELTEYSTTRGALLFSTPLPTPLPSALYSGTTTASAHVYHPAGAKGTDVSTHARFETSLLFHI